MLLAVLRDARMFSPMEQQVLSRPRIGVPWRTAAEEAANQRAKIDKYMHAVERMGGEAMLLSLASATDVLKREVENLDAFLLTGSPADIDPAHYGAKRHPAAADADAARERTDFALLEHALAAGKPVLAICYGIQSLNVFLSGSLIQDIMARSVIQPRPMPTPLASAPISPCSNTPWPQENPSWPSATAFSRSTFFSAAALSRTFLASWARKSATAPKRMSVPMEAKHRMPCTEQILLPDAYSHLLVRHRRTSTLGITNRCSSRGAACALRPARRTA